MTELDLSDFAQFVHIVEEGGLTAADQALDEPESRLNRRITQLEETLGVRPTQQTIRQFNAAEARQTFCERCKAMLMEAQAAQDATAALQVEPRGVVELACLATLLYMHIGPMLARFMARYPDASMQLEATNRHVDVVGKGLDVAIRARPRPFEDSDLVMHVLADRGHRLYASLQLVEQMETLHSPTELMRWPGLSLATGKHVHHWELLGPQDAHAEVHSTPHMITTDMLALRKAAVVGMGVIQPPQLIVED